MIEVHHDNLSKNKQTHDYDNFITKVAKKKRQSTTEYLRI